MNPIAISGYRTVEQLYSGTRTLVYRGISESDNLPVVIKLLKSEYPTFSEIVQFRNQYAIAKKLECSGVVKHLSLEVCGNGFALVMEDFGGISLAEYITDETFGVKGRFTNCLEEFLRIAIQLCSTLDLLYQNGIVHKDIKPQNILINPKTKEIKLIDFSISSLLPKENPEIKSPNVLEGTLAYMSPEQTGRMNRGIDYRTDFYSLGVTFYELLTGRLPFQSTEAIELVHCHIARQPLHPIALNPVIPQVLNYIVLKLMAKTAEDRYQTALGIKYDLEKSLREYLASGTIQLFELASRDISQSFIVPEKLYGRETEVATLLAAFQRVACTQENSAESDFKVSPTNSRNANSIPQAATTEIVLVAGFSGIGKTAVINEVQKPIVQQRGYFIKGKFDQFKRDIPFSAWVQALQGFLHQLLTESADRVRYWQSQILSALGDSAQVIIDVIPELEMLIGQQPAVPELEPNPAANRFNLLFQKFIRVFATKNHPLVIFLDDLQWADSASLKLMQLLIEESEGQHLLLIGAYRDNEVSDVHPLMLTLLEIRDRSLDRPPPTINRITLAPLLKLDLNRLVADALSCPIERSLSLTELIFQKTTGNPFFSTQFLKKLHEDKLIYFDVTSSLLGGERGGWQCDLAKIRELTIGEDIVEFVASQLQELPLKTQNVLKLAACIGNQFDLVTAALVCEKSQTETAANLWKALQEGLILPQSEVYKFFADDDGEPAQLAVTEYQLPSYKFLHDRVQQAAYSLIPDSKKQLTHLNIGRLLLKNTPQNEQEERIFDIVNHLNIGKELMVDRAERNQLAALNLIAGRKAKTSTAYAAAVDYLTIGRNLLPDDCWLNLYDLAIDLYVEAVEAEYLNTNFELSQQLAKIVLSRSQHLLDKFRVYEAQIQSYIAQNQMRIAVDTGLQVLEMLGVSLESKLPAIEEVSALANLPEIKDAYQMAALRILCTISSAAYLASPEIYPSVVFTMAHICSKYGNSAPASYAYACCSLICEVIGEIDLGYQYGQLALQVLDRFPAKEFEAKVVMVCNASVRHWKEASRSTIPSLRSAVQSGLETGDIEYACYAAMYLCIYSFFSGEYLTSVDRKYKQYLEMMVKSKQEYQTYCTRIWWQLALNLQGLAGDKLRLVGDSFNEDEMLPVLLAANNVSSIFGFYFAKLVIDYLFGECESAVTNAQLAEQYIAGVGSMMMVPQHNFYYSLALLALYPDASTIDREQYLDRVILNQQKMQTWAFHAPMNYQHKYDLVAAEIARLSRNRLEASDLYDRAIADARENHYFQEEALAGELAAKFYQELGKDKIARVYLTDAYYAYARWGSEAKVRDLQQKYSQLLGPILQQEISQYQQGETIYETMAMGITSTNKGMSNFLDLETVIKAFQAISGEINIEELLSTLLRISIENAGASKGSLILARDGELSIVAKYLDDRCYLPNMPLNQSQHLPVTAINYVWRTSETLVINDIAEENIFISDPYIKQHQPKSVLCAPIVNQGKAIGILYLENSLATGVFTPDRLEVLKILSAQAAISIENALLYQTLEDRVKKRTAQLDRANQEISALNQRLKTENLRMSADLDMLKQMQQLILPKPAELAAIAQLDIAGFMEPADEVGGDYYDVLFNDGVVTLCIGDVTGHGLESGIVMVMTQAAVRTLKEVKELDPVRFLDTLNRTIYKNIQRMNSDKNLTLALLNYAEGKVSISGQHEETIVVRKGGKIERIDMMDLGFPIGLDEDISGFIGHVSVDLEPGDGVVLYTDGIPEARNIHKQFYGAERLYAVVSHNWHLNAESIKQAAIDDLREFIGEQRVFDDITLLVLKQQGNIVHNLRATATNPVSIKDIGLSGAASQHQPDF